MEIPGTPSLTPVRPKRGKTKSIVVTPEQAITRLGRYVVTSQLGRGGMGIVYEAEDTLLQRKVAVKLLPIEVSSNAESLARFLREAQAAAKLNHTNVVAVYDIGESAGMHYIVLELMSGGNAQDILSTRGPFPWREATEILRDICRGVSAAHKAGLIHRDIKPANILRSVDDIVKLSDFGLVKPAGIKGSGLTGLGEVVGTPHFMSPEQSRCDVLDLRSDLYSLGATYFALLTGRPPFINPDSMQVLFAHCAHPVPDPRELIPEIPEACTKIIIRAMEKSRMQRYRNAAEFMADLEKALTIPDTTKDDKAKTTPIWTSPKTQKSNNSLSLVDAYSAERTHRLKWIRRMTIIGICLLSPLIAISIVFVAFTSKSKINDQTERVPAQPEDWSKLSVAVDHSIQKRDIGAMKRVREQIEILRNRILANDAAQAEAIQQAKARLDKALMFRESITDKGRVIGLDGPVSCIQFSPDDKLLAIGQNGGEDGAVVLDSYTGDKRYSLWPRQGNARLRVQSLAFDKNSTTLAAACTNNYLKLSNLKTRKDSTFQLGSNVNHAMAVAFSPTSDHLVTGMNPLGEGKGKPYLRIWNIETNKAPFLFKVEHSAKVATVAFTAGGHQVVTGSHDKRVILWSADNGRIWRELRTALTIRAVACSPHGRTLAVAGEGPDGPVVQLWDYGAEKLLVTQPSPHGNCQCVAFSHDGTLLAMGSGMNVILGNAETLAPMTIFAGHSQEVTSVAFSAEGGILASGSTDQTVRIWDIAQHYNSRTEP